MSQRGLKPAKLSDVIVERIEKMILEGVLTAGQKLPPEREMAEQFEVSRPSLREALQKLEARNLINRRQGGGNYIAEDINQAFDQPLLKLLKDHGEFKYDLLEFRHALEEMAAFHAAQRASDTDRKNIEQKFQQWLELHEAKQDSKAEASADLEFHLAIAEASHNIVLLHTMRSLFSLLEESISNNLNFLYSKEARRANIKQQHTQMKDAILSGDAEQARLGAHHHLVFVEETLSQAELGENRNDRALRRLEGQSPFSFSRPANT